MNREELMRELVAADPTLAGDEARLEKILAAMDELKDRAGADPIFRETLRARLMATAPNRTRRVLGWWVPALAVSVIAVALIPLWFSGRPGIKSSLAEESTSSAPRETDRTSPVARNSTGDPISRTSDSVARSGVSADAMAKGHEDDTWVAVARGGNLASLPADALALNETPVPRAQMDFREEEMAPLAKSKASPSRPSGGMSAPAPAGSSAERKKSAELVADAKGAKAGSADRDDAPSKPEAMPAARFENPFIPTSTQKIARVSPLVGRSSYGEIGEALVAGRLPGSEQVRLEELLNHFDFQSAREGTNAPLSLLLELLPCPWNPSHRVALVLLRAGGGRPGVSVDRLELEFDPKQVGSWRLLGYEPGSPGKDQIAVGKLAAGEGFAVACEVIPFAPANGTKESAHVLECMRVHAVYRGDGSGTSKELRGGVTASFAALDGVPRRSAFALALLEWGLVLRKSPHRGNASIADAMNLARRAASLDPAAAVSEFLRFASLSRSLR